MKLLLLFVLFVSFLIVYLLKNRKKTDSNQASQSLLALNPAGVFTTLTKKTKVTYDSYIFNLKFPSEDLTLGLPIGQHITVYGKDKEGNDIERSYTPISMSHQKGSVDLLIKIYFPTERFPNGGALTNYLYNLEIGSKVKISGPKGKLEYKGSGKFYFKSSKEVREFKTIAMIAGGTGITPMYQVIKHILADEKDKTELHLLFANKSTQDILLLPELKGLQEGTRLKISYTIDRAEEGWDKFVGFVSADMIKSCLPPPSEDTLMLACGPGPMNTLVKGHLKSLNYDDMNVFVFQLCKKRKKKKTHIYITIKNQKMFKFFE